MLNREPLVSVLMGVYQPKPSSLSMLRRAVDSMLFQDYPALELLLCDDGSAPSVCRCLEEYAARDSRVRLIRRGDAFTLPQKLNLCLLHAKGAYLVRMDDDDYALPSRLSIQMEFLKSHPEFDFVGSNAILWREGSACGERMFPAEPTVRDFLFKQPFLHPTLLFRREALERVGGYSELPRCILCEDYDLLLRLYEAGSRGANLQEKLICYTLPLNPKGSRRLHHRWNEVRTRLVRFRALGLLPGAFPYVIKPLVVGLIPSGLLRRLKSRRYHEEAHS